jgi:hypothetical protein
MKSAVRIGGASGFWGDSALGIAQLVTSGDVDYVVLDYLAELTMSIMAKLRERNPNAGYATDFVGEALPNVLPEIAKRGIKILTNAGGMNPKACAAALEKLIASQGLSMRVGTVEEDAMHLVPEVRALGIRSVEGDFALPENVTSFNAYTGAFALARALELGADIVIAGRCADSALALAPLIHEFGWAETDYDKLAAGSMAGHLIECGTQATGGLFTDWRDVPGRANLGYPIAECRPDGSFELFKPRNTGGLINRLVAAEQFLYEVGDPQSYLLPDVTCDLTDVTIDQVGTDRVRLAGFKGRTPTDTFRANATFEDGFRCTATLTIVGHEAVAKAEAMATWMTERMRLLFRDRNYGDFDDVCAEVLGSEQATFGAHAGAQGAREVTLRLSVRHQEEDALKLFAKEIAPFGTSGAPGTTGFSARPKPQKTYRVLSLLIPKTLIDERITVGDTSEVHKNAAPVELSERPTRPELPARPSNPSGATRTVPLYEVAVARSGDKGDTSNIAVIARNPEVFAWLAHELTPAKVKAHFAHLVTGEVEAYLAPGAGAINFLLRGALAGGGSTSLRNDALGKAFGQVLLSIEVDVPAHWVQSPTALVA